MSGVLPGLVLLLAIVGMPGPAGAAPPAASTGAASNSQPGRVFRDCGDCPEMVVIGRGEFLMGSPDDEDGRFPYEGPQHRVRIRSFAAGRYEVTRKEFAEFMRASGRAEGDGCYFYDMGARKAVKDSRRSWRDPGFEQTERDPAVCVNWEDARAYVEWLSRKSGKPYRLMSEAEAEYVARAGTRGARPWGEGAGEACRHANVGDRTSKERNPDWIFLVHECSDGYAYTSPAGALQANAWGLHDTFGNALEWVEDCFHDSYAGARADGGAWTSGECDWRVVRGGGWQDGPANVRSARRKKLRPAWRLDDVGFRVARTIP